ncbi:MAG: hypothetical protein KGJ86_11315 [Chloroflexota bacterium]|nr:hypothetical protein [Chloroflexota bacterium]
MTPRTAATSLTALRTALVLDALVFLTAAALNFGVRIPLGFVTVAFPVHILPAGIGEAVIGTNLLCAGITARRGWSWLAFWLSVGGIAFGLVATSRTGGPAWDVHLILVPVALIILGLLLWTAGRAGSGDQPAGDSANPASRSGRQQAFKGTAALMVLTACTLLVASLIHFGPRVPLGVVTLYDPFAGAAVPEAVLGILLGLGAAFLMSGWAGSREMALASAIFTLLLSLYGLSITLGSGRTGDVVYHVTLLALLAAIIVGLFLSRSTRQRERRS